MRRFAKYRILKAFAVLAALAQIAVGGFAAAAAPADLARIICLPSGGVSPAAEGALADLFEALDLDGGNAPDGMGAGCSLCVLAHAAPPSPPVALKGRALSAVAADLSPAHEAAVKQMRRGPPTGVRAPPFSS